MRAFAGCCRRRRQRVAAREAICTLIRDRIVTISRATSYRRTSITAHAMPISRSVSTMRSRLAIIAPKTHTPTAPILRRCVRELFISFSCQLECYIGKSTRENDKTPSRELLLSYALSPVGLPQQALNKNSRLSVRSTLPKEWVHYVYLSYLGKNQSGSETSALIYVPAPTRAARTKRLPVV